MRKTWSKSGEAREWGGGGGKIMSLDECTAERELEMSLWAPKSHHSCCFTFENFSEAFTKEDQPSSHFEYLQWSSWGGSNRCSAIFHVSYKNVYLLSYSGFQPLHHGIHFPPIISIPMISFCFTGRASWLPTRRLLDWSLSPEPHIVPFQNLRCLKAPVFLGSASKVKPLPDQHVKQNDPPQWTQKGKAKSQLLYSVQSKDSPATAWLLWVTYTFTETSFCKWMVGFSVFPEDSRTCGLLCRESNHPWPLYFLGLRNVSWDVTESRNCESMQPQRVSHRGVKCGGPLGPLRLQRQRSLCSESRRLWNPIVWSRKPQSGTTARWRDYKLETASETVRIF